MSSLTANQVDVLAALAGVEPPWVLTGGGALGGFHLGHRPTRDVDLFWRGAQALGWLPDEVIRRLVSAGFEVSSEQVAPAFRRLRVVRGAETVLVDLVADPVPAIEPPDVFALGAATVLVDSRHEILVNKLTALLSRSEVRDLVDVRALVEAGGDLDRALADAPRKDGGFSGPTLAWLLRQFPLRKLGADPQLVAWRDAFVARLLAAPQ